MAYGHAHKQVPRPSQPSDMEPGSDGWKDRRAVSTSRQSHHPHRNTGTHHNYESPKSTYHYCKNTSLSLISCNRSYGSRFERHHAPYPEQRHHIRCPSREWFPDSLRSRLTWWCCQMAGFGRMSPASLFRGTICLTWWRRPWGPFRK